MPRVNGHSGDAGKPGPVPEVFHPALEAHRLRMQGEDWATIAGLTGYPSAQAARMARDAFLQKVAMEQAAEMGSQALAEELARLDFLQKTWWPDATGPDKNLDAAKYVLEIIKYRSKLEQLEKPNTEVQTGAAFVISGSEEEYVAALKQLED